MGKQLLSRPDLRALGIEIHRVTLHRMVTRGHFPKPVKVGSRSFWVAAEVEAWLAARVAARDQQVAAIAAARGAIAPGSRRARAGTMETD